MELVEAQDYILTVLGSTPTGDITSQNPDAQAARQTLTDVADEYLESGYWFNSNFNIVFEPLATTKEILLPANVITFEPILQAFGSNLGQEIVQRGNKLYDSIKNTYQFDQAITANTVITLEWDLLPHTVQNYVRYEAAAQLCSTDLEDEQKAEAQRVLARIAHARVKRLHLKLKRKNVLEERYTQRFRHGVRPFKNSRR